MWILNGNKYSILRWQMTNFSRIFSHCMLLIRSIWSCRATIFRTYNFYHYSGWNPIENQPNWIDLNSIKMQNVMCRCFPGEIKKNTHTLNNSMDAKMPQLFNELRLNILSWWLMLPLTINSFLQISNGFFCFFKMFVFFSSSF